MKYRKERVIFESETRTFSLYCGDSQQYSFCVSPEGDLEHLYFGPELHSGYDLRYLLGSSRQPHFETQQLNEESLDCWETASIDLDVSVDESSDASVEVSRRKAIRMSNLKWRLGHLYKENLRKRESVQLQFAQDLEAGSTLRSNKRATSDVAPENFSNGSSEKASTIFQVVDGEETKASATSRSLSSVEHEYVDDDVVALSDFDVVSATLCAHVNNTPTIEKLCESTITTLNARKGGELGAGSICKEWADVGTGDYRSPSFEVVSANGMSVSPVKYYSHRIVEGRVPSDAHNYLPGVRVGKDEATTLIVTMQDEASGLEVDLHYCCLHRHDAVCRKSVIRNAKSSAVDATRDSSEQSCCDDLINTDDMGEVLSHFPKVVNRCFSCTIDFESSSQPMHLVRLVGSWARERSVVETKLSQGMLSYGSIRGVSSHQQNPFACVSIGAPSEDQGDCVAFSLLYSGNFLCEAELSEMGRLRVNIGVNPMGFSWFLSPNESFHSPECLIVKSSVGLGGVSRALHRIVSDNIMPNNWCDSRPPIIFNSWEARYFDVSHRSVLDLARQALSVNADLLILDDGWFGSRYDDSSSIGDWRPNRLKFPYGLKRLVEDVNDLGLKFGIWIEPEMVSIDSQLYKDHPDWCLSVPNLAKQVSRKQLVLDLSRSIVRDHLFDVLSGLFSSCNIRYVKWDMNRPLTEVYSSQLDDGHSRMCGVCQGEIGHRFVLGLYELLSRLIKAFPYIAYQHSASGGGRFDLGMLYFSSEIWCSDNTDALARLKIQYGTSLAYPARCIASHISAVPNHITGNMTRAKSRVMVAMSGSFGYELDLSQCADAEIQLFKESSYKYLNLAPVIRDGDLYRLWDPFKSSFCAWMFVSRDRLRGVCFAFSLNSDHWSNLVPRLTLRGLRKDAEYMITEPFPNNLKQQAGNFKIIESDVRQYQLGQEVTKLRGSHLMMAGLPVKFYTLDDSVMFVLDAREGVKTARAVDG